jgi:hypothetical protein
MIVNTYFLTDSSSILANNDGSTFVYCCLPDHLPDDSTDQSGSQANIIEDESGNIIVCNNIMDMLKQYSYLFKLSGDFNDKNLVKLVTYTNNRISALNKIIRNFIYDNPNEYEEREILTGYDTCICGKSSIENSRDYMVLECKPIQINCLDGYELLLDNGYFKQYVKILSRNNPEWKFQSLIAQLEGLRQKAVRTKSRKD